jgi:hypothetical protein
VLVADVHAFPDTSPVIAVRSEVVVPVHDGAGIVVLTSTVTSPPRSAVDIAGLVRWSNCSGLRQLSQLNT